MFWRIAFISTFFVALPSVLLGQAQLAACDMRPATITGYFTPVESDYYEADSSAVQSGSLRPYPAVFLRHLLVEWMGVIDRFDLDGDGVGDPLYVGRWDSDGDGSPELHTNLRCSLDAQGACLSAYDPAKPDTPGTAASNALPQGTLFRVGGPAGDIYRVSDTIGDTGGHTGMHIDLYMGEGKSAEAAMYGVTKLDGTGEVCVLRS